MTTDAWGRSWYGPPPTHNPMAISEKAQASAARGLAQWKGWLERRHAVKAGERYGPTVTPRIQQWLESIRVAATVAELEAIGAEIAASDVSETSRETLRIAYRTAHRIFLREK